MTSDRQTNLWWASSREQFEAQPLAHDTTVDLAVIGGGFTGCSAALEAARQGAKVCLLEHSEIGHGGSGRNVGLVNAGLWLPPDTVLAQMGHDAGQVLIDFLSEAPSNVFALIEREGIDCEATRNGTLHLAHTPSGLENLKERYHQGLNLGAPLKLLDQDETSRRTGSTSFYGSLLDPRAGTIQPLSYCRGLARAAISVGAAVHPKSGVTNIKYTNGYWFLEANGHHVKAKALLMATNAYHLDLMAPFTPSCALVSYSQFATAPLSEADRTRILPGGEGCWDTALVMSSIRVDKLGRLIVGGLGNIDGLGAPIHHAWANQKLRQIFPNLTNYDIDYSWQGQIAMTGDHIPKIVEFGPSALACFGYSGRGIGPGTVFGAQAASALLNSDTSALPVSPIQTYTENFIKLKSAYYEFGATLTHAFRPLQKL